MPTGSPSCRVLQSPKPSAQSHSLLGLPRCTWEGRKGKGGKGGRMTGQSGVVLWILESQNARSKRLGDGLVQTVHFQVQHHTWSNPGGVPEASGSLSTTVVIPPGPLLVWLMRGAGIKENAILLQLLGLHFELFCQHSTGPHQGRLHLWVGASSGDRGAKPGFRPGSRHHRAGSAVPASSPGFSGLVVRGVAPHWTY